MSDCRGHEIEQNIALTHLEAILERPIRIKNARTNEYLFESNTLRPFWLALPRWKIGSINSREHSNNLFLIQKRDNGYTIFSLTSKDYLCVVGEGPEWDILIGRPSRKPTIFRIKQANKTCNSYTLDANVKQKVSMPNSNLETVPVTNVSLYQSDETNGFVKANKGRPLDCETEAMYLKQKSYEFIFELQFQPIIKCITPVSDYQIVSQLPNLESKRFVCVNDSDLEQKFQVNYQTTEIHEGSITYTGGLSLSCGAKFAAEIPLLVKTEFNPTLSGSIGGNSGTRVISSTRISKQLSINCKSHATTIVAIFMSCKKISIPCRIILQTTGNFGEVSSFNDYRGIIIDDFKLVISSIDSVSKDDLQLLNLDHQNKSKIQLTTFNSN